MVIIDIFQGGERKGIITVGCLLMVNFIYDDSGLCEKFVLLGHSVIANYVKKKIKKKQWTQRYAIFKVLIFIVEMTGCARFFAVEKFLLSNILFDTINIKSMIFGFVNVPLRFAEYEFDPISFDQFSQYLFTS